MIQLNFQPAKRKCNARTCTRRWQILYESHASMSFRSAPWILTTTLFFCFLSIDTRNTSATSTEIFSPNNRNNWRRLFHWIENANEKRVHDFSRRNRQTKLFKVSFNTRNKLQNYKRFMEFPIRRQKKNCLFLTHFIMKICWENENVKTEKS